MSGVQERMMLLAAFWNVMFLFVRCSDRVLGLCFVCQAVYDKSSARVGRVQGE